MKIIDIKSFQVISQVKDYNCDLTQLIIVDNLILTIGVEPRLNTYRFDSTTLSLNKVDSKFIFKADCTAMVISRNSDRDSDDKNKMNTKLILGGDEGYVKLFNIVYGSS